MIQLVLFLLVCNFVQLLLDGLGGLEDLVVCHLGQLGDVFLHVFGVLVQRLGYLVRFFDDGLEAVLQLVLELLGFLYHVWVLFLQFGDGLVQLSDELSDDS